MALVRNRLIDMIAAAVSPLIPVDAQTVSQPLAIELDIPKMAQHGDYATNLALSLTRVLKRKPRDIATEIVANLQDPGGLIEKVEIAGPGFLNFFINPQAWLGLFETLFGDTRAYGRQNVGQGRLVQVEFVSANPTGPLHIGHGRGAAVGDVVANVLEACGYDVQREYYINDAGNQMNTLGASLYYRYQEILGESVEFPDGHYKGEYMLDLAREFREKEGDRYRGVPLADVLPIFSRYAGDSIFQGIKDDLRDFGVRHDHWFSEQSLHDQDAIRTTIADLEAQGFVYEEEGAKWFRSTAFGDEKDRVVIRGNGISTYFAADLAYHRNKFSRGFDMVVDIWGADHHGYVDRLLAGIQAMGRRREDLRIILVQLVNLLRGGKPVAMSTRAGEFVTLKEVVDEVGRDAARYIFLTRRSDSPLDFDLEVAKMQSNDNPVFYVQYAHARLCRVFEVAEERGVVFDRSACAANPVVQRLVLPEEIELLKRLGEFPEVVANCARALESHFIPYYLQEIVSLFHSYYNANRILGDDPELTQARLCLSVAVQEVIRNALTLLGVSAPEKM